MDGFEEKASSVKTEKLNVPKSRKLVSDPEIQEMLMHPMEYDEAKVQFPAIVQPKANGIFALWHAGKKGLYTKDGKRWRDWLPEMLGITNCLATFSFELYKHGLTLQEISSAIGVNNLEKTPAAEEIEGWVFNWLDRPKMGALERIESLQPLMWPIRTNKIWVIPHCIVNDLNQLKAAFERNRNNGHEGSIIHYAYAPYTPGKSWVCMKQKNWKDAEGVITSASLGEGKASEGIGRITVNLEPSGIDAEVGTFRMTYEKRKEVYERYKAGQVIRVKVQWISESLNGVPLNASVTQVIED
jgi:hypothetical protein